MVQGFPKYTKDYEGNFDWLKYGSAEPLETRGETPIDSWTADQKKMGLESTPAQEGGTAYCYGKNGYVKLGDDARTRSQPADPVRSGHPERHGRHGPFQRHRLCGGRRHERQRRTGPCGSREAGSSPTEPPRKPSVWDTSIPRPRSFRRPWKNSQQEFIIFSHPKNPFTSNTRMELMAGKYEMESGNTRIFIDNLYVLRLKWYDFEDLFGKLPWEQNAPRH